jgi:cellulose synthase/poly-beta-1,6-N-acetylglucosamine synthase-like glycosyltransferase
MLNITDIASYIFLFASIYFNVFLLISFFEKKKVIKSEEFTSARNFRSVTVIVPVFNEEKSVAETLRSLLNVDYPTDKLKIIVVDDGSTDRTWEEVQKFKDVAQIDIYHKENGGKHSALNFGIERTETELVACLDADSFVLPDSLKKLVQYFDNDEVMAVTPAIKIYQPNTFLRNLQSNEYNLGIFFKKALALINGVTVTPGPLSVFRKNVIDAIGGFRKAHNTEDMEIAFRMHKHHYKITNAHQAVVYTLGPDSYKKLYRQRVRWVRGFLANAIDYKFLFFKKKYSGAGMFTLPFSVISIIGVLILFILAVSNFVRFLAEKIVEISTIGFHITFRNTFDLFFVNTSAKIFLGMLLICLTVVLIGYGRKISEKKISFSWHSLYFPFVYSIIALPWLLRAIYLTLFSKETKWK